MAEYGVVLAVITIGIAATLVLLPPASMAPSTASSASCKPQPARRKTPNNQGKSAVNKSDALA